MTQRNFKDGDIIFLAGDAGDSVFTLLEGKVELSRSGDEGRVRLALLDEPGKTFGTASADNPSAGKLRPATAQAVGSVVVDETPLSKQGKPAKSPSSSRKKSFLGNIVRMILGGSDTVTERGQTSQKALTNMQGVRAERIEIRVAKIVSELDAGDGGDAVSVDHTPHIVKALSKHKGVRVKALNKTIPSTGQSVALLEEAASISREWLADANADLLVWGEVPPSGTTLHLRFISAIPVDDSRPGGFELSTSLNLPVGFGPEMAPLLMSTCLAATAPATDGKNVTLVKMLPDVLYAALPIAENLPVDVISAERATILMCLANAIAVAASQAANNKIAGELFEKSANTYKSSLALMSREENQFEWALVRKNFGEVMLALADIRNDSQLLDQSADAFSDFLKIVTRIEAPRLWASVQSSLGLALYRIDIRAGDAEVLKHSLASFQEALKVYTRADTPLQWAEVMSNFAQAAQVLGKQLRNPEVLEKAVHACQSVLEVRKKEKTPMLWAATQNNLGSALFMLGKMTGNHENIEGAAEAFRQSHDFYTSYGALKLAKITEKNLSYVEKLLEKTAPKGVPRMRWETDEPEKDKKPVADESQKGQKKPTS